MVSVVNKDQSVLIALLQHDNASLLDMRHLSPRRLLLQAHLHDNLRQPYAMF